MYLIETVLGINSLLITCRIFISFSMAQGNWNHFDMEHRTLTLPRQTKYFLVQSLSEEDGRHWLPQRRRGLFTYKVKWGNNALSTRWPTTFPLPSFTPREFWGSWRKERSFVRQQKHKIQFLLVFLLIWRRDPRILSFINHICLRVLLRMALCLLPMHD